MASKRFLLAFQFKYLQSSDLDEIRISSDNGPISQSCHCCNPTPTLVGLDDVSFLIQHHYHLVPIRPSHQHAIHHLFQSTHFGTKSQSVKSFSCWNSPYLHCFVVRRTHDDVSLQLYHSFDSVWMPRECLKYRSFIIPSLHCLVCCAHKRTILQFTRTPNLLIVNHERGDDTKVIHSSDLNSSTIQPANKTRLVLCFHQTPNLRPHPKSAETLATGCVPDFHCPIKRPSEESVVVSFHRAINYVRVSFVSSEKLNVVTVAASPQPSFGSLVIRARNEGAIIKFHQVSVHKLFVRSEKGGRSRRFKELLKRRCCGHCRCCHSCCCCWLLLVVCRLMFYDRFTWLTVVVGSLL